ncbi:hypothetical protein [Aquimarina aquimarini]|uniref:hypothetical protein n=1 Tax=Aquimarina aquimarini TaxID=1191734 RepID=UPI000D54C501|nr:hypothetical protein [Aquimarina aquimarini]
MAIVSSKYYQLLFVILFFTVISGHSQVDTVHLVEKKLKKRTIIYVQNDTDEEKNVFLKINPVGYRKSAQRPIIKNIPAKSKIQMRILIPLLNVESHYTYDLIVNKEAETIDLNNVKQKDSL